MLNQMIFTCGAVTDASGKTEMVAVKTLSRNLDYIEPESDILIRSLYSIANDA